MNEISGDFPVTPDATHYYDRFAETGEYENDCRAVGWLEAADFLVGEAIETKPGPAPVTLLDLATGSGLAIEAARRRVDAKWVTAVDASPKMLDLLRAKKLTGYLSIRDETIQQFVETCDEGFDLIACLSAAEFLPNLPVTLRRTARLLNEEGCMVFTYLPLAEGEDLEELMDDTEKLDASAVVYRWFPEEIEASMTDSGLVILEHSSLAGAGYPVDTLDYNFLIAARPAA